MDDIQLLYTSVIITLSGLILSAAAPDRIKSGLNAILVILLAVFTSVPAIHALLGNEVSFLASRSPVFGDIPVRIDALSAWFILIINFTCINGAVYGIGYMKPYSGQRSNLSLHWMLFLLFHSSMLWVCMLQNSLAFLISWEIMSLSSLFLVIFEHGKKNTLKAGLNYLVQMHISVAFLTTAFIWIYYSSGSFDFEAMASFFRGNPNTWLFLHYSSKTSHKKKACSRNYPD